MQKDIVILLISNFLLLNSCTFIIKSSARYTTKDYNKYANIDVSNLQVIDKKGRQLRFSEAFAGKAVYLYIWKEKSKTGPEEQDKKYSALKQRFAKYPDIAFAKLSINQRDTVSDSYRLVIDQSSAEFRSVLNLYGPAPFILGKDGKLLAYKGPKPSDELLVDYVLYQARNGLDGTKSARMLIKSINSHVRFKTRKMRNWYTDHFQKSPDSLRFSFSSTD